jgi:hypothetical protein
MNVIALFYWRNLKHRVIFLLDQRISLLLLVMLQLFLTHNLFLTIENHARFIVHFSRTTAIFIFIIITINIYWSSYFHLNTSASLFAISGSSFLYSMHDNHVRRKRERSSHDDYIVVYDEKSNTVGNHVKLLWSDHDFINLFSPFFNFGTECAPFSFFSSFAISVYKICLLVDL